MSRTSSNRLPVLADEIGTAHDECRRAGRAFVQHAIEAGRRLIEAKAIVPHGEWRHWLAENVPALTERTAQRYMRAATAAGKNDTVSFLALRHLIEPTRRKTGKDRRDELVAAIEFTRLWYSAPPEWQAEFRARLYAEAKRQGVRPEEVVFPDAEAPR